MLLMFGMLTAEVGGAEGLVAAADAAADDDEGDAEAGVGADPAAGGDFGGDCTDVTVLEKKTIVTKKYNKETKKW